MRQCLHIGLVTKEKQGVEADVSTTKNVDAAEFLTVSFKSVLEFLDALSEPISNLVEFRCCMNARIPVVRAIGCGRHRREEGRSHPISELKHGMVLTMTEKRQLRQIMVGRAMCAEVPCEKTMGNWDVLNLVAAVKNDYTLFICFHQFVLKSLRETLNSGRVDACSSELGTRLLDVDSGCKLNVMALKERKYLKQKAHDVSPAVSMPFAEGAAEIGTLDLDFQPIVPMCRALRVGWEIGLLKVHDSPGDILQIALVKHQGAQKENRLAITLCRIKRSSVARFVNIAHQHFGTPYKTSAATSFDAAAGLAALTKHGIGLETGYIVSYRQMGCKGQSLSTNSSKKMGKFQERRAA